MFVIRDVLTIIFAFNLPKELGEYLHRKFDIGSVTALTFA